MTMRLAEKRCLALRSLLCALLVMVLIVCAPLGALAASYESEGFESPEAAVQAYMAGVQDENLEQMLSAFAIETLVEHYDFEAMLGRVRAYTIYSGIKLPNTNPLFQSLNVETRKNEIVQSIMYQLLSFHMPDLDFTQPTAFTSDDYVEDIARFLEAFESNTRSLALKSLELGDFIAPESLSDVYLIEQNQQNMSRIASIQGADEVKSMVASFTVEGKPYILCCDAVRYGDVWYLLSLGGNIAQLLGMNPYTGGLVPMPQ